MKLLVFAHTPPPHHGQSYAVKTLLENFGGDCRKQKIPSPNPYGIECYHVNARFSRGLADIGEFQGAKILLIFWFWLQAVWVRFRYGVENFYYVPAPGKPVALYRDWLVLLLCRPFFKKIILHWHAAGLAKWLETVGSNRTRSLTHNRMKYADLSIVLSEFNRQDAEKQLAQKIIVVSGGISDPCPQLAEKVLPRRRALAAARKKILAGEVSSPNDPAGIVRVLYVALASRAKGVFDAIEGVALANQRSPLQFRLTVIGGFASDAEETELREFVRQGGWQDAVEILGFVPAGQKNQAFADADIFCFPTYYSAENQPGNLIEAMAFGLPIITTRWRSIPEMLPENYPGIVDPKSPAQIAAALRLLPASDFSGPLREIFLRCFTLERHLAAMAAAIRSVE